MTKAATNSEQTVEALLAERQRYDAWLAALEERRGSTPSHIYDRVHADYAARLQRVVEELAQQRSALRQLEHTIMDRLTALDVEEAQHRDEAAEAELRAAVGELTPGEHDEVMRRTEAALARIGAARDTAVPELSRIRAVLDRGSEAKAAEVPPAPLAPAEEHTESSGFDELNFLKSLVESRLDNGDARATHGEHATHGEPSGERQAPAASAAQQGSVSSPGGRGTPAHSTETSPTTHGSDRVSVQHDDTPTLKGVQADQVKSLKCQECGTLNYPTEWYCERCGAELAAL